MERETGIEPATNSLEGCDSTIELLPHFFAFNDIQCATLYEHGSRWIKMANLHKICIEFA